MRGIVIYKGKYGATEQYAAWAAKELKLPLKAVHECSEVELGKTDILVMGTSVYIGVLAIKEWVKNNLHTLAGKKIHLFVVCGTPLNETEKLQQYVKTSIPEKILENCKLYFLPGRLRYKKLSWTDKVMLRVGYFLSPKAQKEKMHLNDYDDVKKENLSALIEGVSHELYEVDQPAVLV